MMKHWSNILPNGTIYNIKYEEIVENQELEVRKLLQFVGIPWEDRVLKFWKNHDNIVETHSASQVRKPLFNSSIDRWKKYEKHLQPLLQRLQQYL